MNDCYQIFSQFFLECLVRLFKLIKDFYLSVVFCEQVLEIVEPEPRQPVAETYENCLYISSNDFIYKQV